MSQNDPWAPGQVPPPPPPQYPVTSDIPPDSPQHYSPAPSSGNRSLLGGIGAALLAVWGFVKYGLLIAFKIPAFGTIVSLVISFGGYAIFYGPWFAVALLTMIFVHEMGHVVEIRRQGMQATAPIFIPFLGAAIFQRSHPTAALIGFYINLFNLIPVWQLDGAWILAPVSKWFQVAGYAIIAVGGIFFHFLLSPLIIIIAVLGIPSLIQRFRDASNPYYTSVPAAARWAMGFAWLVLVIYLGVASLQVSSLLGTLPR